MNNFFPRFYIVILMMMTNKIIFRYPAKFLDTSAKSFFPCTVSTTMLAYLRISNSVFARRVRQIYFANHGERSGRQVFFRTAAEELLLAHLGRYSLLS